MNNILVIDDDLVLHKLMKRMLFNFDPLINVEGFFDARYALEYLRQVQVLPNLIFLDINMPEMNAWQFLDALSVIGLSPSIPIYILSSSIDERDMLKAKEYDLVRHYLVKPIKKEVLNRICEKEL